ncbi:hypothetical protein C8R44DRAFT_742076 [Mycena epipterygia]|nr:hypothetical protein C8R44DRAFT_742076 [Mycena epipterygia]
MRTLLHHDYETSKLEIYSRMLGFIHRYPDTRFVVGLDYTGFSVSIAVEPFDPPFAEGHLVYAAAASSPRAGRIELHMMQVGFGGLTLRWLIPLRRNNTQVYDRLQEIVRGLPQAYHPSELSAASLKVQSLLSSSVANAIEFH